LNVTLRKSILLSALILLLLFLPWIFQATYTRHILVMSLIYSFSAMGLNVIFGFAGQAAFGQPAFFALGAYISSLLALKLGLPFSLCLLGTMVLSAGFGFIIGYPCLQLRGIYFGITTMAFAQILYYIVSNWVGLTRGPMGLVGIPAASFRVGDLFQIEFNNELKYYYLVLAVSLLTLFFLARFMETRLGRAFVAIRENQELSSSIGIHPFWVKMIAFMLACMITSMGGSFYAHFVKFVSPVEFQWYFIGLTFIMVITGGIGTLVGPFLGGAIFTILPEIFRAVETYRNILVGSVLILIVIFFPEGVMGKLTQWRKNRNLPHGEKEHA
jgi:branched-chain amino acid transport system permease protein